MKNAKPLRCRRIHWMSDISLSYRERYARCRKAAIAAAVHFKASKVYTDGSTDGPLITANLVYRQDAHG